MVHILLGDNVGTHKTFSVQDIFAASRTQCEFFEPNTSMFAQPNDDIVNRWVKLELENIVGQIRLEHFIEYRDDLFSRHGKDKVQGGLVDIEQWLPPKLSTAEVLSHFIAVWGNIVTSPKWPKSLLKSWRKLCLVPNIDDKFTAFAGFNSFTRMFAPDGSPMEPKYRLGPLISGVIVESRSGATEFESDKPAVSGISFAQPALSDSTLLQAPAAPHSGPPPDSPAAVPTAEKELRVSEQPEFGTVNIKLTTCWLGAWRLTQLLTKTPTSVSILYSARSASHLMTRHSLRNTISLRNSRSRPLICSLASAIKAGLLPGVIVPTVQKFASFLVG